MLLGLDADPYIYDDITDNLWPFKTRNRGKENEYIQFSTYSIRLTCLQKHFQELSPYSDDDTIRRYKFYSIYCSTYRMTAMTGSRQYSLSCTLISLGHVSSRTTASASDVVVDAIPNRETEVNHSYSPQLKKIIFCSYFIGGAGVELRSF
jgi:hypothetical protein